MKKSTRHIRPNERGSAILLALGILSLALILGMAFAFTARTDRQIAQVSADTVKVRLLSESALERMLAAMKHSFDNSGDPYVYPATTNIPPPRINISASQIEDSNYWQHYLTTIGGDKSDETHNSFEKILLNNFAALDHVNDNLTTKLDLGGAGFQTLEVNSRVVGRIGYLLLEEGGKFDLNECLTLKTGANTPFVTNGDIRLNGDFSSCAQNDFIYNLGNTNPLGTPSWDETNTVRQGLLLQELQVEAKFLDNLPEKVKTRLQWFSYQHLYDALGSGNYTAEDFLKYTFFSAEEPEAWWHPGDKKEYHRFDLSSYEWRSGSADFYNPNYEVVSANTGWSTMDGDTLVNSLSAATLTEFADDTNIDNIPYLSQLVDINEVNVSKHVAANLVDYCDENDFVTTDFDLDWSSTPPAPTPPNYCGLEKAAAVSEVGLEVVIERTDPGTSTVFNYKVKIQPSVDFVNIFSEAVNVPIGQGRLLIQGTLEVVNNSIAPGVVAWSTTFNDAKFSLAAQSDLANTVTYTDEIPFVLDASVTDQSKDPYYLLCNQDFAVIPGDLAPYLEFTLKISKVVVQMEKTPDTEIYDVAYCDEPNFDIVMVFPGGDTGDSDLNFYASMEAEDPRCNHRSEFWKWTDLGNTKFTMGAPPSWLSNLLNQDGSTCNEETSVKFSTAYIRNAPPKSFWELGAIHRGEPMRTINLKKFTAPETSGGSYQEGDAAILDQVKMGPLKYSRGKYNPNAQNIQAVLDLLPAIEDGGVGNYEVTAAADSPLPMPDAALLAWPSDPSPYRGQFAEVVKGNDDTYADDRQAEAAIGCTANLLSTRHDPYTLVIVAQAMKELRKPNGDALDDDTAFNGIKSSLVCHTIYKVSGTPRYCDILGTQLYLAHIIRNAWTNEFRVIQGQYLE